MTRAEATVQFMGSWGVPPRRNRTRSVKRTDFGAKIVRRGLPATWTVVRMRG